MATTEKWAKLFKSRHQYMDSIPVQFGDAKDAAFNWNGTNLQLLPVADDTGAFHIGDGTTDFDVKIFLGASGVYALFDVGNARFSLVGVDLATDAPVVITDATESTSTSTGALIVSGGIANAKDTYLGDDVFLTSAAKIDWAAGNVTLTHATGKLTNSGALTNTGAVNIDDTTESTSTTTGSLQTDGGLACAKDFYAGDDIFLTSGAVLNWNAGNVTLTHSAATLTLAGGQLYMAGGVSIVGIKLGTLSSTTPGSGLTIDATTTRGLEVNVDDNNTARAVGTQGRAIMGRAMIYADNACEDWGVHGLSKISGVAKTGNVSAGITGAFESTGTCSIDAGSGNSFFAGVMGRVGGGGTFTITAGNVVGVLSFYNTTTANNFTGTGTVAFMATASDIAGTGNWDYGLYIEDSVYGVYVNAEPTAAGRVAKFSGSIAAPNLTDGYGAFEVDVTFSGTIAGTSAAFSSWVNIAAAAVPGGNLICAQNNGIYLPSGITASSAKMVMGMRMQYVADDGANPGELYCFSTNIYSNVLTAIFDVNAIADLGGSTGAQTGNDYKVPLFRDASAGQLWYVNVYHT